MDTTWPACHVLASLLWTIGIVLAVADLLAPPDVGALGIVAAAGAGTLNIRGWVADSARRERNAFQLGVADSRSNVKPLV